VILFTPAVFLRPASLVPFTRRKGRKAPPQEAYRPDLWPTSAGSCKAEWQVEVPRRSTIAVLSR
jgi:hypothetical protein